MNCTGSFVSLCQSSSSNLANTRPVRDSVEQLKASWIDFATRPFNVLNATALPLLPFLSLILGVTGHSAFKNSTTRKTCSCHDARRIQRRRRVGWQERIDGSCHGYG